MRRQHNRARLVLALDAAAATDGWLGRVVRGAAMPRDLVAMRPALAEAIAAEARRSRLLPDIVPELFALFRDRPELARWMRTPQRVEQLSRLAGAARHGGALRTYLDRDDIARIVDRLGEPVWRYAIERGDASFMLTRNVDDVIDQIEADGRRTVAGYLRNVVRSLHPALMAALGPAWQATEPASLGADEIGALRQIMGEVAL